MLSVLQRTARASQDLMEMTTPSKVPDTKEKPPSMKSSNSQTRTSPDVKTQNAHGEDAIPSSTTGEPATEQVDRSHLVANEDYSVFTVGQKRAIIFAGSFAAWFSPMASLTPTSATNEYQLIFR
jgi:hypothetical protein